MKLSVKFKLLYAMTKAQGVGRVTADKLLEKADLEDKERFLSSIAPICADKEYASIVSELETIDFDALAERLDRKNIRAITCFDNEYPDSLKPYRDRPIILYCKGDITLLREPCFAVIGTRFPTKYGERATKDFVTELAKRFCIVSGMARGMDACAHAAAIAAGGKTIAVLGCGVDVVYPPENVSLYSDILASGGLIISEYEAGEPAKAFNFPARNRIISGLSTGVLVTEAGIKSGTMLTVNAAEKQGKAIFSVPGSIYSKASEGCNRSIRECQARAVLDVNDIYDELGLKKQDLSKPKPVQLDFNEATIVKLLSENGETHFEEILEKVNLSVPQLSALLVKMEAEGLIYKIRYNFWSVR